MNLVSSLGLRNHAPCALYLFESYILFLTLVPFVTYLTSLLYIKLLGRDVTEKNNEECEEGQGLYGDIFPNKSDFSDQKSADRHILAWSYFHYKSVPTTHYKPGCET